MTPPSEAHLGIAPIALELILTIVAVLLPLGWPHLGSSFFARIERVFAPLARKRGLAVAFVGFSALLLRLAILPVCPIPIPFVPDDFSFLLSADTFAHGRLTNPTPAMWTHFESIHISMQPTYMSMYFPAQGLMLAAGKVLLGNFWYGQLIATVLMCAAICWMLQAWLPATWAFLGGMLAVVHLGLFSYWINTYHGASIAGLAGALVLGALPRLIKTARPRYGVLLATGIAILALSRPFEGVLLCLPVGAALGHWALHGKNRPRPSVLFRRAAFPLLLIVAAVAWLGYYDYRAFGSPITLPYSVNRATYAMAPYFVWQKQRPEPYYRHAVMRDYYSETEVKISSKVSTVPSYLLQKSFMVAMSIQFFAGIALLPPLIMLRRVFLDRRIRFLILCVLVMTAGMAIQIFLVPHYLAPFTAAFYAIGLQAMRHLRFWSLGNKPTGLLLVRLSVMVCILMAGFRLYAGPLHLELPEYPPANWNVIWYGPDHFGTDRLRVESMLEDLPGKQLAIVRYSSRHNPFNEWVYNSADIDGSKVIWAREMDGANNIELIQHYKDRKAWLVQPDLDSAILLPYPFPEQTQTTRLDVLHSFTGHR
jgi:hypothetical protein